MNLNEILIEKELNEEEIIEIKEIIEMIDTTIILKEKLSKKDSLWLRQFTDFWIAQK